MQFKLTSVLSIIALVLTATQAETQKIDAKLETVATTEQLSKVENLSASADAFNSFDPRTFGIQDNLVGDVFNGIVNQCGGNCNNLQYFGPQYGGYYSLYYPYSYYQYNWDGSYTVYLYNFNGYGYSNTIAITCYNNNFNFAPYNQGYLYRVPQNSRCIVRYI